MAKNMENPLFPFYLKSKGRAYFHKKFAKPTIPKFSAYAQIPRIIIKIIPAPPLTCRSLRPPNDRPIKEFKIQRLSRHRTLSDDRWLPALSPYHIDPPIAVRSCPPDLTAITASEQILCPGDIFRRMYY